MRIQAILACLVLLMAGCGPVAQARPLSQVFGQVSPAVVKIVSQDQVTSPVDPTQTTTVSSMGSGVVATRDGLVMTAAHVVNVADKVAVQFLDGRIIEARVVASAGQADVALLKLEEVPDGLKAARLGDSNRVKVGDQIFVVGAPYGIDHTLTVGHISGRRQSRAVCNQFKPFAFLQTDAAINQGNSGGPMFTMDGEVVGIVSHILSRSGGSEGLGFATSVNTARDLLLEKGSFWIGFEAQLLAGPLAQAFNLPQEAGLLVQRVARDSPAGEMGLRPGQIPVQIGTEKFLLGGDVVLEIQGFPVVATTEGLCGFHDVVGGFTSKSTIEIKVLRQGKVLVLKAGE